MSRSESQQLECVKDTSIRRHCMTWWKLLVSSYKFVLLNIFLENEPVASDGATYTRWGRTTCPDNTAQVYEGKDESRWRGGEQG